MVRVVMRTQWVECQCGKVREVWCSEVTEKSTDLYLKLLASTPCKRCEAEVNKVLDSCPETLQVKGGISACSLGYQHKGKCEPYPPLEAVFQQKLEENVRETIEENGEGV